MPSIPLPGGCLVVRGEPTEEELAAIVVVLAARSGSAGRPAATSVAAAAADSARHGVGPASGPAGRPAPHRPRLGWTRPTRYRSPASWRAATVH